MPFAIDTMKQKTFSHTTFRFWGFETNVTFIYLIRHCAHTIHEYLHVFLLMQVENGWLTAFENSKFMRHTIFFQLCRIGSWFFYSLPFRKEGRDEIFRINTETFRTKSHLRHCMFHLLYTPSASYIVIISNLWCFSTELN